SVATATSTTRAAATGRTLAVGQHVVLRRRLVRIVVEHHHLIGEELLLRRAHGIAAATGGDQESDYEQLRKRSPVHRSTPGSSSLRAGRRSTSCVHRVSA